MEKTIEIPFGAKGWEYTIPENMEAEIKDGKIIVKQKESESESIRKEIISALKFANDSGVYDKHIAYLEKQKEQKPACWSEEDERNFYWISTNIQERHLTPEYTQQVHKILSWLKSLRPQSHWKPSKEQIEALENEIKFELSYGPHTMAGILQTLYDDLKKL